jgi:hypothetical protein
MCQNQLVGQIGPDQSFSVLGVALIPAIGGVLIVLGALVDTFIGWLQVGHEAEYRRTQWILEGMLQLQRAAYEGFGFGTWKEKLEDVSTTTDIDLTIPPSSDVFLGNTGRNAGREDKNS